MDDQEIDTVARLAEVSCCGCLVRRQVDGMQHVTEKLISLRRKKAKRRM